LGFKKYRVNSRVINDLKKRSTIGIAFYIVVVCIVLFSDGYYYRYPEFSNRFLFLITGICLFRLLHLPVARWTQHKFERINNGLFFLSVAVTALIWGVGYAKFMIQNGEPGAKLLMVICTIGLCSGGVVAFIPELVLSIAFNFFILGPAILTMIVFHTNMPLVMTMTLFFIYLCFVARRGNREYWVALENEYLLEEKSKDLEKMSRVDSLTGLYNRRFFDQAFLFEWNRSVRNKTPVSIIIGDIDNFKRINDQYGHQAGDEYLKALAGLFKTVFKRKTDITARYGGEEFVVLMPDEPLENAFELAETLRLKSEQLNLEYGDQTIRTTMSLGVATCVPGQNDKSRSLISRADKALYQSKANGRNMVT